MCGNRVEELEARVQELEASVEGLTDELVECKVRIREMENTVDEESGFGDPAGKPSPNSAAPESGSDGAESETTSNEEEMLVPEPTTSNTGATDDGDKEAPADSESESESESEDDSGSDIIVA